MWEAEAGCLCILGTSGGGSEKAGRAVAAGRRAAKLAGASIILSARLARSRVRAGCSFYADDVAGPWGSQLKRGADKHPSPRMVSGPAGGWLVAGY